MWVKISQILYSYELKKIRSIRLHETVLTTSSFHHYLRATSHKVIDLNLKLLFTDF